METALWRVRQPTWRACRGTRGPGMSVEGPTTVPVDPARAARRRHTIFISVSAIVAVTVIVAARSVLLPFALAFVIAYVLTPAVDWVESRRVPRAGAILIVYIVVLGSLGLFIRLTAPR